jgi:uncharacterized protein YdbL (DUF1318 family)
MKRLLLAVAVTAAAAAGPSGAQTPMVDAARQAGQVGERFDGYMGMVVVATPAVRSQVNTINIRRRALYSRLGVSRGVAPYEVGITAGCQLLARVQVGQAYMLADGRWRVRASGQPAPIPEYCR